MAVEDHLKIASAELMKAADLVKVEIDNLRRQETSLLRDVDNRIAEHLRQIQHFEYEYQHADDPRQSSQARAVVLRMQNEVAQMRAELRSQRQNIENAIRQKSGMVTGLESQARAIIS